MDQAQEEVGVIVLGAGLAGLTAAAEAARRDSDVVVLDVRSPGGRARSDERDRYIFNQGPHAVYRQGPGAAILADLGLHPRGALPATTVAGWKDHRLGLLPTSATSLIRSPFVGWRSKAQLGRLLVTFPRLESGTLAEMSAAAWVRSLGLRDDAASVLSTLIRVATYAPDLEAIAADAAVRQLQLVQTGGVSYLHGGWTELVKGLVEATTKSGGRMATEERAVNVAQAHTGDPSASWEVRTSARTWVSRAVIIATGSPAAARSLLPFDPDWSLGADATAACLDLGLRHPPANLAVFGIDQPLYLSTHAPSAKLAPKGAALVHVMRYGARSSESDRAELWEFAQGAGIRKEDVVVERFLHRMVVTHSLPVPGIGLTGRPPVAVGGHPGLFIAGDWVGPIGLLADAAIASGQAAGQAAAAVSNGPSLPIVDERRAG